MISWFKKNWEKPVVFLMSLWPALRIFLRWPMVAISIATIPIQQLINKHITLGPVTSKIVGIGVFGALMIVSWYAAELIIVLAAIALMLELFLFIDSICSRYEEELMEAA